MSGSSTGKVGTGNNMLCTISWSNGTDNTIILFTERKQNNIYVKKQIELNKEETEAFKKALEK